MLDNVRLHADDVTVGHDEVGGGKMLDDDTELMNVAALATPSNTLSTPRPDAVRCVVVRGAARRRIYTARDAL